MCTATTSPESTNQSIKSLTLLTFICLLSYLMTTTERLPQISFFESERYWDQFLEKLTWRVYSRFFLFSCTILNNGALAVWGRISGYATTALDDFDVNVLGSGILCVRS